MPRPRQLLRVLSLITFIGVVAYWARGGAHTGWSMDRVPVEKVDEITGLEYTEYEERHVPGIDFLGTGIAIGGVIFAASFFLKKQPA